MPKHIIDSGNQNISGDLSLSGNLVLTNPAQTLTNLGGGAAGIDVFKAATPISARAAMSIVEITSYDYANLSVKDPSTLYIVTY